MSPLAGDLAGRRIVLTGASGGIGIAIARHLDGLGARLVMAARNPAALEAVRASLPGGPHRSIIMDVTDEEAWPAAAARMTEEGGVDGLVAAAGILGPIGPVGSWTIAAFRRTLEVNVVGTLLATVNLLDALRTAHGAVVALSGGGATSPLPRYDAYAASKAALVRLTENMAVELAPAGVRVNCVAPGFVATPMHRNTLLAGPELAGPDYYERTRQSLESGGDPPDLAAELTAFLLSREAEGITGRLISARWDPWREAAFRARLRDDPALGRLRRIDDQFFSAVSQAR
jgi:NAD(P)-dependent dehydrogenase (short-subunit alcohol dehydrogenase family)